MTVLGLSETIPAVLAFRHLFLVFSCLRLAVRDISWKSGLKWLGFFNSFVVTLTNWCAGNAELQDLERDQALFVAFASGIIKKPWRPSKSLWVLSPPASSAVIYGLVWNLRILWREWESSPGPWQQSRVPCSPRRHFWAEAVSAGFMSSLSLWALWLPALLAGSEARLTISDGTNHNGALKKIWIIDLGRVVSL